MKNHQKWAFLRRKKYDRFGENWKQWDQAQKGSASGNPFPGNPFGGFGNGTGRNNSFRSEDLGDLLGGFTGERRFQEAHQNAVQAKFDITLKQAYLGTSKNITFNDGYRQRRIEVSVPPGVDNGSKIHINLSGTDVYLNIKVTPHHQYLRKGNNIYIDLDEINGVAIMADTDNSKLSSISYYQNIYFSTE